MALDELERKAAQRPGTAVDLLKLIAHDDTSKHKVELRPDGSRRLLGARIRLATLTGLDGAPSWRDETRGSCNPRTYVTYHMEESQTEQMHARYASTVRRPVQHRP